MQWHLLAPTFLVTLVVAAGTYFGRIQWFGMQVGFWWFESSGVLGDISSHLVYFPAPIFVGFLLTLIAVLAVVSFLLLGSNGT